MDLKRLRIRIERRARELGEAPTIAHDSRVHVLWAIERDRYGAYRVGRMLKLADREVFVDTVYRALLGRPPRGRERTRGLVLASNRCQRSWLILRLRYGSEGRVRAVRLQGRQSLLLRALPGCLLSLSQHRARERGT